MRIREERVHIFSCAIITKLKTGGLGDLIRRRRQEPAAGAFGKLMNDNRKKGLHENRFDFR